MSKEVVLKVPRNKKGIESVQTQIDDLENKMDQILNAMTSIKRQLILMNSRIDSIDEKFRAHYARETNRKLRGYAMHREDPIKFVSHHHNI